MNITLFKTLTKWTCLLLLIMTSADVFAQNQDVHAQHASIRLKPAKCVSLHQGQVCYADVELSWQSQEKQSYCLLSNTQSKPLACWKNASEGVFSGEVSSNTNVLFTLIKQGDSTPLASAEMKMAWVYKKRRAAVSWRVF